MSLGSDWSAGFSGGANAVNNGLSNAFQMRKYQEEQDKKRREAEVAKGLADLSSDEALSPTDYARRASGLYAQHGFGDRSVDFGMKSKELSRQAKLDERAENESKERLRGLVFQNDTLKHEANQRIASAKLDQAVSAFSKANNGQPPSYSQLVQFGTEAGVDLKAVRERYLGEHNINKAQFDEKILARAQIADSIHSLPEGIRVFNEHPLFQDGTTKTLRATKDGVVIEQFDQGGKLLGQSQPMPEDQALAFLKMRAKDEVAATEFAMRVEKHNMDLTKDEAQIRLYDRQGRAALVSAENKGLGNNNRALDQATKTAEMFRKQLDDANAVLGTMPTNDPNYKAQLAARNKAASNLEKANATISKLSGYPQDAAPPQLSPTAKKAGVQVGMQGGQVVYVGKDPAVGYTTEAEALASFQPAGGLAVKQGGSSTETLFTPSKEEADRRRNAIKQWWDGLEFGMPR